MKAIHVVPKTSYRMKRLLNVDDEVAMWRERAGWFDDDKRMKAFNDGTLSSTSSTATQMDKQYWINLLSTIGAFITALLVMYGFFHFFKITFGSDENTTATNNNGEESPRKNRNRSRSKTRRSKSRRASRSRSYHKHNRYQERKDTIIDPSSNLMEYHYPEDNSHFSITATEYTLMDTAEEGGEKRDINETAKVTDVVQLISEPISPTSTEAARIEAIV